MTRTIARLLVLLTLLSSMAVSADIKTRQEISSEAKAKAPHVSAPQLAAALSGDTSGFFLLDVRTEAEFDAAHIKDAQWLPRGKLEFQVQQLISDPAANIVVYCGTGARAALATLTLQDMGYRNAAYLEGGFKQWLAEGRSVHNMHGELKAVNQPTEK